MTLPAKTGSVPGAELWLRPAQLLILLYCADQEPPGVPGSPGEVFAGEAASHGEEACITGGSPMLRFASAVASGTLYTTPYAVLPLAACRAVYAGCLWRWPTVATAAVLGARQSTCAHVAGTYPAYANACTLRLFV